MPDPKPKVVLITGASSGFGLLTAARLAARGHHVIATLRDPAKAGALLNEVKRRGGKADIQRLDVTDTGTVSRVRQFIIETHGHLDALVNNAGYFIGGAFEDITDKEFRDQMETNFFGALNVTREMIPLMRNRPGAKVINISSVAGFSASPGFSAYNASKWALEGFSEALFYELGLFGVGVHLIQPGAYKTEIFTKNRRLAANFHNEKSPYHAMGQFLWKRTQDHLKDLHKDPEEIAELAQKLVEKPGGKFRNIPDLESRIQYALRKILPFSIYSRIIKMAYLHGFRR
jgi:NAD(P)-dependent dehydrogenase (short-subunit alcohol dehydrogenase family)